MDLANRLATDPVAAGYEIWQNTTQICASYAWHQEIEDGLRNSQIVIALLNPHAVQRQSALGDATELDSFCLDEISYDCQPD